MPCQLGTNLEQLPPLDGPSCVVLCTGTMSAAPEVAEITFGVELRGEASLHGEERVPLHGGLRGPSLDTARAQTAIRQGTVRKWAVSPFA